MTTLFQFSHPNSIVYNTHQKKKERNEVMLRHNQELSEGFSGGARQILRVVGLFVTLTLVSL